MKIEQLGVSLADTPRVDARLCQDAGIAFGPDVQLQVLPPQRDEVIYTCDLCASLPVAWLPSHFGPPTAPNKAASARRRASMVARRHHLAGLTSAQYLLWVANTTCVARALVYSKRSMKA